MNIKKLEGNIIREIDIIEKNDELYDEIIFFLDNKEVYSLIHDQSCCERVTIEDICGDIKDLINTPILSSYEYINSGEDGEDSYTWTFYNLSTIKGSVTIRWYGVSNGWYSEKVDFVEVDGEDDPTRLDYVWIY